MRARRLHGVGARLRALAAAAARRAWLVLVVAAGPPLRLLRVRFLVVPHRFVGHVAAEPDLWLKEADLGLRPRYRSILLLPDDTVANRHLGRYWDAHLRVVRSPRWCRALTSLAVRAGLVADTARYLRDLSVDDAVMKPGGFGPIVRRWDHRPPLLSLSPADRARGWQRLRELGVPEGAWFVCVQNRHPAYYQRFRSWFTESAGRHRYDTAFRDCDIENYLPAMQAVVDRGGWCIRVGDPTSEPLAPRPRVIDYAHSDARSDWMDVFLCATCRFFLGNTSGLSFVSSVFGVPVARANVVPAAALVAYHPLDLGVPKLVWSAREERLLSFREVFASPAASFFLDSAWAAAGLEPLQSSADDIRDLCLEMLDATEGRAPVTADGERLQGRFEGLFRAEHFSYGSPCRVATGFLARHRQLLDPVPAGTVTAHGAADTAERWVET